MKKFLIHFTLVVFSNVVFSQTTSIPDANFEQALIDLGYDSGTPNGVIPTANLDSIKILDVSQKNISDLTGLEDFSALEHFSCSNNPLNALDVSQISTLTYLQCALTLITSLDVTQNALLTELHCIDNLLTQLDVSQNSSLEKLYCMNNQLTNLDVSQNTSLTWLGCSKNQISSLDLSLNHALTYLNCSDNNLVCLNVKNGTNISTILGIIATNNPDLTCVQVDNDLWASTNSNCIIDTVAAFSSNCNTNCITVGSKELDTFSNIKVYPNPTSGNVNVDLGKNIDLLKVVLMNHLGQVVKIQELTDVPTFSMNIQSPSGVYFLKLESIEGNFKTMKILKN